jgi:hypothetical protein
LAGSWPVASCYLATIISRCQIASRVSPNDSANDVHLLFFNDLHNHIP